MFRTPSPWATPAKSQWQLPVRIGPLELTQQPVAALDGGIERRLRGFFAGEGVLQFVVDHIANQNERSEPNPSRIFGWRFQCDLLDRDRRAGIAIVKALRAAQIEGRARNRQIAGVLMPRCLNLRLRKVSEELSDTLVFGPRPVPKHPQRR